MYSDAQKNVFTLQARCAASRDWSYLSPAGQKKKKGCDTIKFTWSPWGKVCSLFAHPGEANPGFHETWSD